MTKIQQLLVREIKCLVHLH